MSNQENNETIIACNISAIDSAEREQHMGTAEGIFASVLETKELDGGYAFRLPSETPMLYQAMQWVSKERLCCSFLTFKLVIDDEFWLELTGSPEVKAFIQTSIVDLLQDTGKLPDKEAWLETYGVPVNND